MDRAQFGVEEKHLAAKSCQRCHTDIFRQWQESQHSKAYGDPIYQQAFKLEPAAHCMNCHAPLWKNRDSTFQTRYRYDDFDQPYVREGVNCAVCHIRNGKIITSKSVSHKKNCILPLEFDSAIGGKNLCAACHQFNFPRHTAPRIEYGSLPMQNTVNEFEGSGYSANGKSCQQCHFRFGHHNAYSAHNTADLREHLEFTGKIIETEDPAQKYLFARLGFKKIGHHFPTGDLFHILTLYVLDANNQLLAFHDFENHIRVSDHVPIADTRIHLKAGEKSAYASIWLTVAKRPEKCKLVFRLQGRIDHILAKSMKPETLHRIIYDGTCEIASTESRDN